jgi:hypothetical protein
MLGAGRLINWVADAEEGARHNCALAAASVTVARGLDGDDEQAELDALEDVFLSAQPGAAEEWRRLVRWARAQHAPPMTRREMLRRLGLQR